MMRWFKLYKFARAVVANLDTREEQDEAVAFLTDNLNSEGKLGVTEWTQFGKMLNILGSK